MTSFNIKNSKIDQLNSTGDNIKVANERGTVNISAGSSVHSSGRDSKATATSGAPSFAALVVGAIARVKEWIFGPAR